MSLAECVTNNSSNNQKSDLCARNAITRSSAEREGPRPTPFVISGSKFFRLENDVPDQSSLSTVPDVPRVTSPAPDLNQCHESEMGSNLNQNGSKFNFKREFSNNGTKSDADGDNKAGRSLLNISTDDRPGRTEVTNQNQNQMASKFWFPRGNRKPFH